MARPGLYIAATVACMTAALFGYSVGFIGGVLVLPSFLRNFHLDDLLASERVSASSLTVTIWLVGALVGVPLGMPVCSRFGRKRCLSFSAALYVLGAALQLVNHGGDLRFFDAGRLLSGLGVGAGTLVSPMYIAEVSPPSERSMLMSGYQTVVQISALVGFWGAFASHSIFPSTNPLQWRVPVAIQLIPGILLVLGTFLIPETPRFHAEKEQFTSAEASLSWLRGLETSDPALTEELEEIHQDALASYKLQLKSRSFFVEATKKGVRNRLAVGTGLMIFNNLCGLNAINYYAPVIFMSAGFTSVSSSLFLTGVFGVVKLISALAFMFLFVRMRGNRFWLQLGSAVCGISMLVLAYCVLILTPPATHEPSTLSSSGIISVLMVYLFAFFFGVSLGPISWNVCSEIFPLHINAQCCAVTTCTQWLFQIVIAWMTPHLLASVGWATYLIYAIFCFVSFAWVYLYVPETRGVPVGAAMDRLFGRAEEERKRKVRNVEGAVEEQEEEEEEMEVSETAALLRNEHRLWNEHRRSSVVAYT